MKLIDSARSFRALILAAALVSSATFAAAQVRDGDNKKEEAATSTLPSTENVVAKYKTLLESGTQSNADKPFSEEVKLKVPSLTKQATPDSEWHIAVAPYLYMTGLSGEVGARGRSFDVDLSFGDILSDFSIGLMGTVEARKKRFVILSDLIWLRLKEERENTPPAAFSSSEVRVKTFIWDPEIGYRVFESDRGFFDVLGGFRMMSVGVAIDTTSGILPGFSAEQRKTWATPVGGFRGVVNVSEKVFLSTKFDIGGGLGADFTTQIYAGGGFKLKPNMALIAGYRYLKTDYDDDGGFLFDTSMNGMIVGLKIQLK